MNVVAAVVADIGNMSFLHLCCVPLREARAEPGATTGLDFGRGCDFALEKGGSLLSGLRRQGGGAVAAKVGRLDGKGKNVSRMRGESMRRKSARTLPVFGGRAAESPGPKRSRGSFAAAEPRTISG